MGIVLKSATDRSHAEVSLVILCIFLRLTFYRVNLVALLDVNIIAFVSVILLLWTHKSVILGCGMRLPV